MSRLGYQKRVPSKGGESSITLKVVCSGCDLMGAGEGWGVGAFVGRFVVGLFVGDLLGLSVEGSLEGLALELAEGTDVGQMSTVGQSL